jgi:hypothetical protein
MHDKQNVATVTKNRRIQDSYFNRMNGWGLVFSFLTDPSPEPGAAFPTLSELRDKSLWEGAFAKASSKDGKLEEAPCAVWSLAKPSGFGFKLFMGPQDGQLLGYDVLDKQDKKIGSLRILEMASAGIPGAKIRLAYPKRVTMGEFFQDTNGDWHQLATTRHTIRKLEINGPEAGGMEFDITEASKIKDLDNGVWISMPK